MRSNLIKVFIIFSFIAYAYANPFGEQVSKDNIHDQVVCAPKLDILPIPEGTLEDLWEPLKKQNSELFKRVYDNLDALTRLKESFDKNDPINISKVFYALKIFSDFGDITISNKDLMLILDILKVSYKVELSPEIVEMINQVDKIKVEKNSKKQMTSIILYTKGEKDINFKLPKMEGASLKHKSTLKFYDNRYKDLQEELVEFFEDPGTGTKKKGLMPDSIKNIAIAHLKNKNLYVPNDKKLSPVKIGIEGLSVKTSKTDSEESRNVAIDRLVLIPNLSSDKSAFVGGTTGSGYGFDVSVELPL